MNKAEHQKIKAWMIENQNDFRDEINEINLTMLTEAAFDNFHPGVVDIPEEWFEIAFEVSEMKE